MTGLKLSSMFMTGGKESSVLLCASEINTVFIQDIGGIFAQVKENMIPWKIKSTFCSKE